MDNELHPADNSMNEIEPCSPDINIVAKCIQLSLEESQKPKSTKRRLDLSLAKLIANDYLGNPERMRRLAEALGNRKVNDLDVRLRRDAVYMMGRLRGVCFIEVLREVFYYDDNPVVFLHAADALGDIGLPALETLLQSLIDLSSYRRTKAVPAIEQIASQKPSLLIPILNNPNPHVRWTIARILKDIGDETCLPELENIVHHDAGRTDLDTVKHMAQRAIATINEKLSRRPNA